jgi:hypothetical protein
MQPVKAHFSNKIALYKDNCFAATPQVRLIPTTNKAIHQVTQTQGGIDVYKTDDRTKIKRCCGKELIRIQKLKRIVQENRKIRHQPAKIR